MKAPAPINPRKKNSVGLSKLNSIQKFLIIVGMILFSFTILPVVVVLFIGLLPTLTVVIVDTKNTHKITTVGCFNVSGIVIFLHHLYLQQFSGEPFYISENIYNIVIMLGAAALGLFLYYS